MGIRKLLRELESDISPSSSSSESSSSGLDGYHSDRPELEELKSWPRYGQLFWFLETLEVCKLKSGNPIVLYETIMDILRSEQAPPEGHYAAVQFVTRAEWGALPPAAVAPMLHPVKHAIFHYDLKVDKCQTKAECVPVLRQLQRKHMREKGYVDLQHNFYVGGDGSVYEGRGWHAQPSTKLRLKEHTRQRVDIAWLGDHTDGDWFDLADPAFDLLEYGKVMRYMHKDFNMIELPDLDKIKPPKVPKKIKAAIAHQKEKRKKEKKKKISWH